MTKLKKRGRQWRPEARRIETAIEASYFAPRCGLTKEEAVALIKAAAMPARKEQTDAPAKCF